jgi:tetratricopeptide (TPR) repeat protein
VPWQVPAPPRHFVGRRSELASLTRLLEQADDAAGGVVIGAVSGMAGVGKTALAVYWAHQVAGRFPDGQLYVNLRGFDPSGSPVAPAAALRGFLDALGVEDGQIPASLEAQAGLYRSALADRRMLILLDNARDAEQVRPLLPGSPRCVVLVTSRARLAGLAVAEHAELLALDVFGEDEARWFLAVRLGAVRVAGEPGVAGDLIRMCARLPLALAIVAARAAAHPSFPLADLSAELHDAARRLDGLDAGDPASSFRTVVSWSYRQLTELPARMLRLLSLHPGPGITAAAAASLAGISLLQAQQALRALADANLITEYLPSRYALHDLLRAFAAEQAQAPRHAQDHCAAVHRMLDHYLHTAGSANAMTSCQRDPIALAPPQPGVSPERLAAWDQALAWLDAERAVLVNVTGLAAETGFDVHAWQLACSLAVFCQMRGHWHDLVATQLVALGAASRLADHDAQARIHRDLGLASAQAGRFRQAHAHLRQALRLYQMLGDHDGQARTRLSIGIAFSRQGRESEAIDSTLDALRPSPADTQPPGKAVTRMTHALALNNLGWFHARLGELPQARVCCEHALELFRDIGNPYGQTVTLDSLGYIYRQAGDLGQAVAHYRLAVDQYRQLGDLRKLADSLARLGDSCQAAADTTAARDAWQQALPILDSMQDPEADRIRAKLHLLGGMNGRPR